MCLFLDQKPLSSCTLAFLANTNVQTMAVWIISLPLIRIQDIFWFACNTNWVWLCTWKHTLYFDCMGISYDERLCYISMKFTVHLRKSLRVFFFLKAAASLHFGSWEMNAIPKTKNSISLFCNIYVTVVVRASSCCSCKILPKFTKS